MRKVITILAAFILILTACGTEEHADSTEAELDAAEAAGRRDALRALEAPQGTMAREEAFFAIRARETELRDAAHPSCADAYARAAEKVLRDSLNFDRLD